MPNIFGQYMKPCQLTTFSPSSIISSVNQSNNPNLIKSEPKRVPWEDKEIEILKVFLEKFGIEKLVLAAKMLNRDRKDVLAKWFDIIQAS
jgi:hypothetical protein